MRLDDTDKFFLHGSGCSQWVCKADGRLLVPVYYAGPGDEQYASTVLLCEFDGETMTCTEHGDELRLDVERGLCEPSLIECGNCGNKVLPHRICPKCGYYKDKQVIEPEEMA